MDRIFLVWQEATQLGLRCRLMPYEQLAPLVAQLGQRLGIDFARARIWDDAHPDSAALQCADGWQAVASLVGERVCWMMSSDRRAALSFECGEDLQRVLAETPPFEFHVFDPSCTWLLCFNDHDFLIGWGEAAHWVEQLAETPCRTGPLA